MIDTSLSTTAAPPLAPPPASDPSVPPADFMGLLLLLMDVGTPIPSAQGAPADLGTTGVQSSVDGDAIAGDDARSGGTDAKSPSRPLTTSATVGDTPAVLTSAANPAALLALSASSAGAQPAPLPPAPDQSANGSPAPKAAGQPATPVTAASPVVAAASAGEPGVGAAMPPMNPLAVTGTEGQPGQADGARLNGQPTPAAAAQPSAVHRLDVVSGTLAPEATGPVASSPTPHAVPPLLDPHVLRTGSVIVSASDSAPRAAGAVPRSPASRPVDEPRSSEAAVQPAVAPARLLSFVTPGGTGSFGTRGDADDRDGDHATDPESRATSAVQGGAARVSIAAEAGQPRPQGMAEAQPVGRAGAPIAEPRVVEQVVRAARIVVRDGLTRMDVQLEPPSLGSVRVSAALDGSSLGLSISAERPETRALLAQAIPEIQAALSGRGFAATSVAIAATFDPPDARRAPFRRDPGDSARGNHDPEERRRDARAGRSITTVDFTV